MIKCKYKSCQYPHCKNTCGKTEAEIIKYLQMENDVMRTDLAEMRQTLRFLGNEFKKKMFAAAEGDDEYTPTCPAGYTDCIYDPAYIRYHYPDWWEELGMPMKCSHTDKIEEGYCRDYDDEDK